MVSWAHTLLPPISLLICLFVLILQIIAVLCYWKKYSYTIDTYFVLICVMVCFMSNTLQSLIGILLETALPSCNVCNWAPLLSQLLYTTTRLVVYLFYLQRARLAQSFKPCVPKYYFTKIFPFIFIIIYISMMLLFLIKEGNISKCGSNNGEIPSIISINWCYISTPDKGHWISGASVLELVVTIFFGYLFVEPLIRLITSNEKRLKLERKYTNGRDRSNRLSILDSLKTFVSPSTNRFMDRYTPSNKPRNIPNISLDNPSSYNPSSNTVLTYSPKNDTRYIQTQELKKALLYNVTLSIISLIASLLTMIIWPTSPTDLFWIPYCDYITNTVTTFMMLGRNRKYLYKICIIRFNCCCWFCCCCCCWNRNNHESINGIFTLNEHNNNDESEIDDDSDESVLSATQEYLQQKYLNISPQRSSIPNYQAIENNNT